MPNFSWIWLLGIVQNLRRQLHVARLVYAVHVAEGGGHGEVGADPAQALVGQRHVFGLGIEGGVVETGVVHAVLLAAGDPEFDFQGHADLGHALQVALAGGDIVFQGFGGEVQHVGAEQGLAGGAKWRSPASSMPSTQGSSLRAA